MTSLRNMRCILRTPPIVEALLERKMNEAWRFRRPGRLATARKHSMLWSFNAPGNFLAPRNASARRFSLERRAQARPVRARSGATDPRSAQWRRRGRHLEPEAEVA